MTRIRPRIALALVLLAGCTHRAGTAFVEIENQQGGAGRPEPIQVDPRVEVVKNEYQRVYGSGGSNIRQRIIIRGPVMIVPAPTPATQPAPAR